MLKVHEHPGKRSECEICLKNPRVQRLLHLKERLEEIAEEEENA